MTLQAVYRMVVSDPDFFGDVVKAIELLQPFSDVIHNIEGNRCASRTHNLPYSAAGCLFEFELLIESLFSNLQEHRHTGQQCLW